MASLWGLNVRNTLWNVLYAVVVYLSKHYGYCDFSTVVFISLTTLSTWKKTCDMIYNRICNKLNQEDIWNMHLMTIECRKVLEIKYLHLCGIALGEEGGSSLSILRVSHQSLESTQAAVGSLLSAVIWQVTDKSKHSGSHAIVHGREISWEP